jgi:hypothetical protein
MNITRKELGQWSKAIKKESKGVKAKKAEPTEAKDK